jgi:hypothetical protein
MMFSAFFAGQRCSRVHSGARKTFLHKISGKYIQFQSRSLTKETAVWGLDVSVTALPTLAGRHCKQSRRF